MSQPLCRRMAQFAVALSVSACAAADRVGYTSVNKPPAPMTPRSPEVVEMYTSTAPTRPHVDVGLYEVVQGLDGIGLWHSTSEMLNSLRREAASKGCDALVVLGISPSRKSPNELQATCLIYTDVAPALSSAPAPAR